MTRRNPSRANDDSSLEREKRAHPLGLFPDEGSAPRDACVRMRRLLRNAATTSLFASAAAVAPLQSQQSCEKAVRMLGNVQIEVAPPAGFVDVSALDADVCESLTADYPPQVRTLAYFVTQTEWQRFRRQPSVGFSLYLIAQVHPAVAGDFRPRDLVSQHVALAAIR